MQTIAFTLQKGGVGKTTVAGNVGAWLAERGAKVLFVDADPQGNLSRWLSENVMGDEHELVDVLTGQVSIYQAIKETRHGYDVLCTNPGAGKLKSWSETSCAQEPYIFCDLKDEAKKAGYNYMIVDMAPASGIMERSILLAADEVITPMTPEFFATEGIAIFRKFLASVKKGFRQEIRHSKIVVNRQNKSFVHHQQFSSKIKEFKGFEFFTIPQDTEIARAQAVRMTLHAYAPDSKRALPKIKQLAEALIPEVGCEWELKEAASACN